MIFALESPRPCPASHVCPSTSSASTTTRQTSLSLSSSKLSLFQSERLGAPRSIVLTPVFSHSCELFCASQKVKSFSIYNIHTLSPKHPGVGYLAGDSEFRFCALSLCAANHISLSPRHRASMAGKRYDVPCLLAPYSFKHLRVQLHSTTQKSSGDGTAVTFQEAARVVRCLSTPRECRKLVPFQEGHAK